MFSEARGSVDLASAAAPESGAAKLHIRSAAEDADGTFGRPLPFGHEFMILPAWPNISGVQPEEACDKEDDNDDADDVENVHGVLQVRQARFRYESMALQETCRSATKFRSRRPELRSLAPLRLHVLRRLVEMDMLVDMVNPSHGNEVVFPVGSIALRQLDLVLAIDMIDVADLLSIRGDQVHMLLDLRCRGHGSLLPM
jgi:hypothetical protein